MSAGRWSAHRARARWRELGAFAGRPLGIGLVLVGMWPSFALVSAWGTYTEPLVALGVYLASLGLVFALWWRGRFGIGPAGSISAGVALGVLNTVLVLQLPAGEPFGTAAWLAGWGAAVPMVLGFSRPLEEPLLILAVLTGTNLLTVARADQSVAALHNAPLHVAMPAAVTASGLVLVLALRHSVRSARASRAQAEALDLRQRVAASTERERTSRFAEWQSRIVPVLDDVATGRRSARDPELAARCRSLAAAVRSELSTESESILQALLPPTPGVSVEIRDLDVGHLLAEADRMALVRLVQEVCSAGTRGTLQVSLLPDGGPGTQVVVVLAADGLPAPVGSDRGTLTESGPRWWYDLTLRCEPAPALAALRAHVGGR